LKIQKRDIVAGVAGLVLLGTTATGFTGWYLERQRTASLETLFAEAQRQEKRSAVVQSISKQMEDIAYQQKEISDEQREEAIQQKRVADEMRQRSEVERMNALKAEEQAIASERQAQDARQVAETERQMAEHQRLQAELSKRMTDTLSFVALARSLGSLSSTQAQLGNTQLAELLAYSSYLFINRYKGDVYYPTIFQSLMAASQSKHSWSKHNGSLMGLGYMSQTNDRMVTVSTYGEILMHKTSGDQLQSEVLLSDKSYDFRDLFVSNSVIYAISRSGHLVVIENGVTRVISLPDLDLPMAITELDNISLLLTGERGLAQYDLSRKQIVATHELDFRVTSASRYNHQPILFDDQGRQHQVKSFNEMQTSRAPVNGRVTAFASSQSTKLRAYGMSDGTIYLYDETTGGITKLEGHLSRISKLRFNGPQLFSSSYDGTMNLWLLNMPKIDPMTLFTTKGWIINFTFDLKKSSIWSGDQNGNLTSALISVPDMTERLKNKIKRNFTRDEWNYYIGRNVPYEKIKE
jgi:WD40 repeat protein